LFDEVIVSAPQLSQGLQGAQRLTPIYTAANFSYRVAPAIGDRYVAIGDAWGFVDPIFSAGVFIAMRSAELAAEAIAEAFRRQDFRARRFRCYAAQVRRGTAAFLALIRRYYDPAFLDLFFAPNPPVRIVRCVRWVLSGAAFDHRPLWLHGGLALLFTLAALRKAQRWVIGLPTASRWHW
jgi:2-polyprenyl-6-methoxyphenol hydroxylase-like FAD-dependent oxidoreductase